MKYLVLALTITCCLAGKFTTVGHPDLITEINSQQDLWEAGENQFTNMSMEEFRSNYLGQIPQPKILEMAEELLNGQEEPLMDMDVPDSFDSRTEWPSCVHPIRDQQHCGSCWAFSASEVLSDRFCIDSGSKTNVVLSPQEMVSCSNFNMGCNGGMLSAAWKFMCHYGLVVNACEPYTAGNGTNGKCSWEKCTTEGQTWKTYKSLAPSKFATEAAIKQEILKNGPIQTGFNVYTDFMNYKSGVYVQTTGSVEGGHAVKIVGWGVTDAGVKYWIVANSWNTTWGLDGFFWLKIGQEQLNFEKQGIAGMANVNDASVPLTCYIPV